MSFNFNLLTNLNNKGFKPYFEQHPFHLVDPSPWPLYTSNALYTFVLGFLMYFHFFKWGIIYLNLGIFTVVFCLYRWFSDVITESAGSHTFKVQQNILLGMALFIASEVMFFFAFFWAFFHFTLSPSIWIGGIWPPKGIEVLDLFSFPLFNTVLLLSSGVSVTWAHRAITISGGSANSTAWGLAQTIFYGIIFTLCQLIEYREANFYIYDGVYGSIFFMMTGFHGVHVLVGTIFILVCFFRHLLNKFPRRHHIGLICAIWYWHFVDIVWIFLYVYVYAWGS